jgi:hypothetical protein
MKPNPLDQLRDRMLAAPDEIDQLHLPPRFREARAAFVDTIARVEATSVPDQTLVTVMLTQTLPRLVHQNVPNGRPQHWPNLRVISAPVRAPPGTTQ